MREIYKECPDCNYRNAFIEVKGHVFSPIVCKNCHALLEISYDEVEDDWKFTVVDRDE